MPAPNVEPYNHDHENEVIPFAQTNFRGENRRFGIKTDDRRRHVYVIGKTGMGKTTLLENFVLSDIYAGHGVCYVDPHGDTADKILDFIPPWRINDVVHFNPADMEFPVGFNILEIVNENQKHLVASGLMGVFKKIWPDVWSARMEYILLNCVLALLDTPGSTLLGISRILADKDFRKKIVENVKDPVVKGFWVNEFAKYTDKFASEAIAPVQNKVGQFLSNTVIRNIVAQPKSTIDIRKIMDERKILIVNLSKGQVGEDSSKLLGGMLITRLQLAAMERVDQLEKDRQDFYLYVDEFQNFATESFANILSEARKYRLNLITAHQYIEQLEEEVAAAVFGNVGTIIAFRVGAGDAEHLAKEFAPTFVEGGEDLLNLAKFDIYLKLMIDGVASTAFSASTLPPIAKRTGSREKVVDASRQRYSMKREDIEKKVNQWAGFDEETGTFIPKTPVAGGAPGAPTEKSAFGDPERQYKATCSRCGKELNLKFPPDPSRPFYCKECLPLARAEAAAAPRPAPKPVLPAPRPAPPSAPKPAPQPPRPAAPPPPPKPAPQPRQETPKPPRPAPSPAPPRPASPPPRQEAPRPERPLPAPPKPGMFGGKIRIVTETEESDALIPPKKPEEPVSAAPPTPEPPKPVPAPPAPEPPKPPSMPSQPRP
ncbi:MAG TPA: type IV secretion system DNA-binding domain-containing protein, partial [Candidatus Baltobacteraceae bacterium]|nr:type IV secretion system DNA-binding domain-containing protein [Candidatus Baltobacteraceae bacterium]